MAGLVTVSLRGQVADRAVEVERGDVPRPVDQGAAAERLADADWTDAVQDSAAGAGRRR
jgi:hypothetical protein